MIEIGDLRKDPANVALACLDGEAVDTVAKGQAGEIQVQVIDRLDGQIHGVIQDHPGIPQKGDLHSGGAHDVSRGQGHGQGYFQVLGHRDGQGIL